MPATELAEAAGLEVDDGILVDEYGRAGGRDDVFAAGDVARFPVAGARGERAASSTRITRTRTGASSARTWPAPSTPYDHLPFFYSDLFELGYEAVGDVDSRLDTVADGPSPNRKGVVAYVDGDGKARGFLLWDVWGKVDSARELIRAGTVVGSADLAPPPRLKRTEPGDDGQREDVEDDVPARDAARRVALREAEARDGRLPGPGSHRRAVQLEAHDDHEDACVDRPSSHTSTPSRNAHPIVPDASAAGSTVMPAIPQVAAACPGSQERARARWASSVASESPPR